MLPNPPAPALPRYIQRPLGDIAEIDTTVVMPYAMAGPGIVAAINDLYSYLQAMNRASIDHGYNRLEDLMQPAGFSGLLSNIVIRSLAREFATATPGLAVNQHGGGRPDLIPRAVYPNDRILQGDQGVEVKTSRARSGWQGHNAEAGWLLLVQVSIDTATAPIFEREPTVVERVMIAHLDAGD